MRPSINETVASVRMGSQRRFCDLIQGPSGCRISFVIHGKQKFFFLNINSAFSELCRFYRNIMFSRVFSHLDVLQVVNDGVYRTVSVYSCGKLLVLVVVAIALERTVCTGCSILSLIHSLVSITSPYSILSFP